MAWDLVENRTMHSQWLENNEFPGIRIYILLDENKKPIYRVVTQNINWETFFTYDTKEKAYAAAELLKLSPTGDPFGEWIKAKTGDYLTCTRFKGVRIYARKDIHNRFVYYLAMKDNTVPVWNFYSLKEAQINAGYYLLCVREYLKETERE